MNKKIMAYMKGKKLIWTYLVLVMFAIGGIFLITHFKLDKLKNDVAYLKESPKPDFNIYKNTADRKKQFFDYFYPIIVNKNIDVINQRYKIYESSAFLKDEKKLCKKYKLACTEENYQKLLLERISIIPAAMALAQAANESGWGTSGFAQKGNNYFGIWCFTKGCGIVPKNRSKDLKHEVRKFKNAKASISYYVDNINRNSNYEELRNIRKNSYDSLDLINGLKAYSARGQAYIDELEEMIVYNKLVEKYDDKMFDYLTK
jgi:Bax protein